MNTDKDVTLKFLSHVFPAGKFVEAVMRDKVEKAKALLEKGADINEKDMCESNALIYAAMNTRRIPEMDEFALKLVDMGADVNVVNAYGQTAIMWAAERDNLRLAKKLIEAGVKKEVMNKVNDWGENALSEACSDDMETLLKEAGAVLPTKKESENAPRAVMLNRISSFNSRNGESRD